jgi:hypothetical protein
VSYDTTSNLGLSYKLTGGVRTTGGAAFLLPNQTADEFEEGIMNGCDNNLTVGGNSAIIQVKGVAGETINWRAVLTYTLGG